MGRGREQAGGREGKKDRMEVKRKEKSERDGVEGRRGWRVERRITRKNRPLHWVLQGLGEKKNDGTKVKTRRRRVKENGYGCKMKMGRGGGFGSKKRQGVRGRG